MATLQINYGTSTNYTITLASLANLSARNGIFVDNTTNKFLDVMCYFSIKLATGTPASDRAINFWFYGSENGINYSGNAVGTDSAITLRVPNNFRGPWVTYTPDAGGLTYATVIPSVASTFGGNIPRRWGVIVENRTGLAFDSVEGNHIKTYSGISLNSI